MKWLSLLALLGFLVSSALAQRPSQREREVSTATDLALDDPKHQRRMLNRDAPADLPSVVFADSRRLAFYVSRYSDTRILSKQAEETLRDLMKAVKRDQIVTLRAYVAGRGDIRRVQTVVSELFTERRQPLPATTVLQVGELPAPGAQVVFEAMVVTRKEENAGGVVWLGSRRASIDDYTSRLAPLAAGVLDQLAGDAQKMGSSAEHVLRVTCFASVLDDAVDVRRTIVQKFPRAAAHVLQPLRAPGNGEVQCEGVARLPVAPEGTANAPQRVVLDSAGQVVAVRTGPGRLAFTSTQLSFGFEEKDVTLAYERLRNTLEEAKVRAESVVFERVYALGDALGEAARRAASDTLPAVPPARIVLTLQGLPSLDAALAVEWIAWLGAEA
jgi:enamine deaminase RidA (YjgF/YER057c/UK114 family)